MNGTLSFYEFRSNGGALREMVGTLNPTCCYQIHLNFLHSEVGDTKTSSSGPKSYLV